MTLRPIGDHLVVKPIPTEEKSASGIIIPDTVGKERSERGEVIAIGPGRVRENGTRVQTEVKVGEKIVFKKYAPDEVKIGNETFLIIGSDDVMAVIE